MSAKGVIAIGDSITNACSADLSLGTVEALSWAQRTAAAISQPLTVVAESGASSEDIVARLLPKVHGSYKLGLVYIGANDVVRPRIWSRSKFAGNLDAVLGS